jgi:hypothetical protein
MKSRNALARQAIRSHLRAFLARETASVSVETVIMFPLLLWAYAAMFIYWDAYKAQNLNLKATYTIADMLSREDGSRLIDPDYIEGMNSVYSYLTRRRGGTDVRVSVVDFVPVPGDPAAPAEMSLRWSYATGDHEAHIDLAQIRDDLPQLPVGSELIVVETRMTWTPPFKPLLEPIGLDTRDMVDQVFTAPRFVAAIDGDFDGDGEADEPIS